MRAERAAALADLKRLLGTPGRSAAGSSLVPGLDAQTADALVRYIKTYVVEGIVRSRDLVARFRAEVGDEAATGITEEQLRYVVKRVRPEVPAPTLTVVEARANVRRLLAERNNLQADEQMEVDLGAADATVQALLAPHTLRDPQATRHVLDAYGVKHILNSHGHAGREASRGQLPVTEADLELIPEILAHPDSVSYGGENARGQPLIRYEKVIGDVYYYVEEFRGKFNTLSPETMYKRADKGKQGRPVASPPPASNVQDDPAATQTYGSGGTSVSPGAQTASRLDELARADALMQEGLTDLRRLFGGKGADGRLLDVTQLPGEVVVALGKVAVGYARKGIVYAGDFVRDLQAAGLAQGVQRADLIRIYHDAARADPQSRPDYLDAVSTARQQAYAGLDRQKADLEQRILGSVTATEADFRATAAGRATGAAASLQERVLGRAAQAAQAFIRGQANKAAANQYGRAMQLLTNAVGSVVKGFEQTDVQQRMSEIFKGRLQDRAVADSHAISQALTSRLRDPDLRGDQQDAALRESMRRIDRVLDPSFYASRTRDGFEQLLQERLGSAQFADLDPADVDQLFAEHVQLLDQQQVAEASLSLADLSPREQEVAGLLRDLYRFIHDSSFAIGKVSPATYEQGRDANGEVTYVARLYDAHELPDGLAVQWQAAAKGTVMQSGLYKARQALDAWKLANKTEDPVYAAVTRLRQTQANRAVYDYAQWLADAQPHLVVRAQGPGRAAQEAADQQGQAKGFVQLGEGYGALSNAWVAQHVAEDFKGFFFTSAWAQSLYDFTKWYGRLPVRNSLKKLVTVYNPGTHLSNLTMNVGPLAWFAGVDPATMLVEMKAAAAEVQAYGPTMRYLMERGVLQTTLGTEALKAQHVEFNNAFAEQPGPGLLGRVQQAASGAYVGTDNVAKVALFNALTKQGMAPEAAADRVGSVLQNARRVAKAYDVGANVPLVGAPFGRWSADLMRILATGVTNRPLHMVAFAAGLRGLGTLLSQAQGEDEAQRKLRESRGSRIPLPDWLGGDVPLSFKVGKETSLDASRLLIPFYLYGGNDSDNALTQTLSKFSPLWIEGGYDWLRDELPYASNPGGGQAALVGKNSRDMLLGPVLQLVADADFRGKPITDADATQTHPSTATPAEKNLNRVRFLLRSYLPSYASLADDLTQAAQGKENFYGRQRTVPQTLLRFVGVKLEQFGTPQYEKALLGQIKASRGQVAGEQQRLKELVRQLQAGKITVDQLNERAHYRLPFLQEAAAKQLVAEQLLLQYAQSRTAAPR